MIKERKKKIKKDFVDWTGKIFGRLTIVRLVGEGNHTIKNRWNCICECGNEKILKEYNFLYGNTKSCGCLQKQRASESTFKHGASKSRNYILWSHIKDRCYNPNSQYYHIYGGKGITLYKEWYDSFETFTHYIGERPTKEHSLDRIDSNKNYEPDNVRWATPTEQANNTSQNHNLTYNNVTQSIAMWERELGFSAGTLKARINMLKWSVEKAIETPVRKNNRTNNQQII
jgi:hypothetical protein